MQSKLAKSVVMMSLSLVIAANSMQPVQVEAKTLIDSFMEAVQGEEDDSLIDLDANVDMEIPLEIEGPSKIVIHDGDKLTREDLLSKFKSSRRNTAISLNREKCYWVANDGKTRIYMDGSPIRVIVSQRRGFDPTFVDVPQHLVIEANSSGEIVRKKVTLIVKHNTVKKVNKYVYMRCDANLHELPNYFTKNLGKINYGTKVKAVGLVKVGKFNWYKVKYKDKVGYIFADNASDKKLLSLKNESAYDKYFWCNAAEKDRENNYVDHNGKKTEVPEYGFSQ